MRAVEDDPTIEIVIDVVDRRVAVPAIDLDEPFDLTDFHHYRLLEGLDDIGLTLRHTTDIDAFEATAPHLHPPRRGLTERTNCVRLRDYRAHRLTPNRCSVMREACHTSSSSRRMARSRRPPLIVGIADDASRHLRARAPRTSSESADHMPHAIGSRPDAGSAVHEACTASRALPLRGVATCSPRAGPAATGRCVAPERGRALGSARARRRSRRDHVSTMASARSTMAWSSTSRCVLDDVDRTVRRSASPSTTIERTLFDLAGSRRSDDSSTSPSTTRSAVSSPTSRELARDSEHAWRREGARAPRCSTNGARRSCIAEPRTSGERGANGSSFCSSRRARASRTRCRSTRSVTPTARWSRASTSRIRELKIAIEYDSYAGAHSATPRSYRDSARRNAIVGARAGRRSRRRPPTCATAGIGSPTICDAVRDRAVPASTFSGSVTPTCLIDASS